MASRRSRWRRRGSGFRARGDELILIEPSGAFLDGLPLRPRDRATVELVARRSTGRWPRREPFRFDVVQADSGDKGNAVVGGVSYEIVTGRP